MPKARTTSEQKLHMRQWRLKQRKNLRYVWKPNFWYGYWEVAGRFFTIKSSLDPAVIFNPIYPLSDGIEYKGAREGYETWKRRN